MYSFIIHFIYRNDSTTALQQVLIALEYYACGSFQRCIADTVGVSKSTVSRIIHRVSKGIAMMRSKWLYMPQNAEQLEMAAAKFKELYKIPKVIGVIDSIHIPIKSPGLYIFCHKICLKSLLTFQQKQYIYVVQQYLRNKGSANIFKQTRLTLKFERS